VAEHEAISGQLGFRDWTVLQTMGTAAAAGALGTQLLRAAGLAEFKIKPLNTGGVVVGGILFGTGMALLGYCPGTSMAAVGAGHKDALAGAGGMLAGALAFVKFYPHLKPLIEKGAFGKRTLPDITGTSPWWWVAGTVAAAAVGAALLNDGARRGANVALQ
jgi:uncharacterized membrane protein YedE/YeeE